MSVYRDVFVVYEPFRSTGELAPLRAFTTLDKAIDWSIRDFNYRYTDVNGPTYDEKFGKVNRETLRISEIDNKEDHHWILTFYEHPDENVEFDITQMQIDSIEVMTS